MAGKGKPKTGGRKKGTVNRLTRTIKEGIEAAFDEVGGESYLVRVAREDPKTFCGLLGKLLPAELKAEVAYGPSVDLAEQIAAGRKRVLRGRAAISNPSDCSGQQTCGAHD